MSLNTSRLAAAAIAAVAALGFAGAAAAQNSASQQVSGTMTLYQPITLAKNSDLSFGTLIKPASGSGNATIDASSGALSATGGIGVVTASTHSRATFTVSGEGGLNFSVTTPQSFNMTRAGGSDTVQVTLNSTTGSGTLSGSAGATGTATFGVGGQIQIASGTPTGSYSGTFTIMVAYN